MTALRTMPIVEQGCSGFCENMPNKEKNPDPKPKC